MLVCPGAGIFRRDLDSALIELLEIKQKFNSTKQPSIVKKFSIKSEGDLDYAFKLQNYFSKISDFFLRIESPWISVYTNSKSVVDKIVKINPDNIKYVSVPPDCGLSEDTIILPKVDFEFRVTLGKTIQEHSSFIEWAENTQKVKLTKSCKSALTRNKSWGGSYFYITGEKNLLLAKMHLGGSINKVERIIKA